MTQRWPQFTEPTRLFTGRKLHLRLTGGEAVVTLCGRERHKEPTAHFLATKDRCLSCWRNALGWDPRYAD